MNYPESSIFSAKHMFPCVISDVCKRKGYQMLRFSIFFSILIFVSGCTLSHISEVKNPFPAEVGTIIQCSEYLDISQATKDIRARERYGWLPSVIGYSHSSFMGILSSTIEICFERPRPPKEETSSRTNTTATVLKNESQNEGEDDQPPVDDSDGTIAKTVD